MTPGDIVLVLLPDRPLDGCLAVVEEVRGWGVIAYVTVPPDAPGVYQLERRAYLRLGREDYIATGGSIIPRAPA